MNDIISTIRNSLDHLKRLEIVKRSLVDKRLQQGEEIDLYAVIAGDS